MAGMLADGQFTLRSIFVTTAFVALACAAARYIVSPLADPGLRMIAWVGVPIFLCGAFGAIRSRLGVWLCYGVGIDIAVILYVLIVILVSRL